MKVCIWTVIPNHYQASFHAALRAAGVDLEVRYYEKVHSERLAMGWGDFKELPPGEQYVQQSSEALKRVADWRERIHVLPGYASKFSRMLAMELSRTGVQWVHWNEPSHPGWWWWLRFPQKYWYAQLVNRNALGAFGIGCRALEDYAKWGIRREKLAMLPYSVAAGDRQVQPDEACETFRAGRLAFIFAGTFCHRKAVDVLLKAFAVVAQSNNRAVLILMGDDRSGGAYERQARAREIRDRVLFRGPVKTVHISSVLRCAQVLVLPSRFDGWGVVMNEGASMGLALIGSESTGASHHLIEPAQNGFVVRAGNAVSLATAMRAYLNDPHLAERHGAHSLKVFERYTPERNVQRFLGAIDSWLAAR